MTRTCDKDIVIAWGCPPQWKGSEKDYTSREVSMALGKVSAAANWYYEMDNTLERIASDGNVGALTEWRNSDEWERICRETCLDRDLEEPAPEHWCDSCQGYVDSVRDAFDELIAAVEESKTAMEGEEDNDEN